MIRNMTTRVASGKYVIPELNFEAPLIYEAPGARLVRLIGNPPLIETILNMFMYCWLDPSYTTTETPEEIIYILKLLNYPFINNIKRSQLLVVGPLSWPNLLRVITWMIPLIQCVEKCDIPAFINDTESEDCFEKFNELYVSRERTKADITCIGKYIEELTNRINQKEKDIKEIEEIKKKKKLEVEQLRSEISRLEKIYRDQEISAQSVEYVNAQKNYLTKKGDENKDLMKEAKKILLEEEMDISSQIEEEMKNEISSLFLQYENLNNKTVGSHHQYTQDQQQLSDQIQILEKQNKTLLENNGKDEAEASSFLLFSLTELMQKTREYMKKLKAIEAKIIEKYEDAQKKTITFFNDTV